MNERKFSGPFFQRRTACLSVFVAFLAGNALAQSAPSSDDMINALTAPPGKGTGESRGFRLNRDTPPPVEDGAAPAPRSHRHAAHAAVGERREIGVPLLFDIDSAKLKPESTPLLASIAKALQSPQLAHAQILLEGHTDASGGAAHNMTLSEQRAQAVKAALVQDDGVDAARLSTIGRGQSEPANPTDPMAAENRRVVLVNLSAG